MHNPIHILLDLVNKRRDPNAPLYAKDTPQDDHDFDFFAHTIDQLQQEPSDPKARKAWAKEHLRRRPKADLTEPIYRFPAVFWKYHTNINPYFAESPAYTDDNRIESLDTLACILRFHGNTMYETRRKHASDYLSQSQARSMAQLDRLATEWCEHLRQGHDPSDRVKYDILVREQRAAYLLHVNKRVKEGAYTNDDPIIVGARKDNRPQPEDELLPPTTLEDAATWIRNLRGWMLDRCHRHIAAATARIADSHGQRSVTHADMVICSLALRLNPPPKLKRERWTADAPVGSSSSSRHPERSVQPPGHVIPCGAAALGRAVEGSGESPPPTNSSSPSRHRTKRLRQPEPKPGHKKRRT